MPFSQRPIKSGNNDLRIRSRQLASPAEPGEYTLGIASPVLRSTPGGEYTFVDLEGMVRANGDKSKPFQRVKLCSLCIDGGAPRFVEDDQVILLQLAGYDPSDSDLDIHPQEAVDRLDRRAADVVLAEAKDGRGFPAMRIVRVLWSGTQDEYEARNAEEDQRQQQRGEGNR